MLYYKLGEKELKPFIAEGSRRWAQFGADKPVTRKLLIAGLFFTTLFVLLGGLAYVDPKNYIAVAKNAVGSV